MIYLWPREGAIPAHHGLMLQPKVRPNRAGIVARLPWAYDNGAFIGFEPKQWMATLEAHEQYRDTCLFVVCPDVVGNALATLEKWRTWSYPIIERGWPIAFVAQDGQELYPLPPEFDALFIGGTTDWKLSPAADLLIQRAHAMGKWVHVGRVNTKKRIRHFQRLRGVDSIDGTAIRYEPDYATKKILDALRQPPLFQLCGDVSCRHCSGQPAGNAVRT